MDGEPHFTVRAGAQAAFDVVAVHFGLGELLATVFGARALVLVLNDGLFVRLVVVRHLSILMQLAKAEVYLAYQTYVWYGRTMPKTPPGQTRERVYHYVRDRLFEGRPPTIRDVQQAFGFRAVESARAHLDALVREGRLTKRNGEARGFALPESSPPPPSLIPILGRVQAGALSTAVEDLEGYLPVESTNVSQDLFALRVHGESMTGAGIFPGDYVVVRRQATAQSGEIVVALVEDEATVKRLKVRHKRIELHPENSDFDVIVPSRYQCIILGRVIEVRRFLDKALSRLRY